MDQVRTKATMQNEDSGEIDMRDGMNWYAVHTKPRQESLAEFTLQRLGVETLCPKLKQQKIIRRKRVETINPLFPGYLFARFQVETHYRAVNAGRGVQRVVALGTTPTVVDKAIITSIQQRVEDGYITLRPAPLSPGQRVRIHEGPFQGLEAVFEKALSDHQRAVLLLQALSYHARVVVDLANVVNG
jgi:transcriptional antiterminator RfaH